MQELENKNLPSLNFLRKIYREKKNAFYEKNPEMISIRSKLIDFILLNAEKTSSITIRSRDFVNQNSTCGHKKEDWEFIIQELATAYGSSFDICSEYQQLNSNEKYYRFFARIDFNC